MGSFAQSIVELYQINTKVCSFEHFEKSACKVGKRPNLRAIFRFYNLFSLKTIPNRNLQVHRKLKNRGSQSPFQGGFLAIFSWTKFNVEYHKSLIIFKKLKIEEEKNEEFFKRLKTLELLNEKLKLSFQIGTY